MSVGPMQIVIIVVLIILLFGARRIPELGKSLGQAIRSFKKGLSEDEIDVTDSAKKNIEGEDTEKKS